ncbi:MAG: hypothetical protein LKF06_08350 [Prevotella sp.]|jgi:hypothetical protein|nr:hypothetical protein [Prevotella sp.]MCH4018268.1 hypothetical protein [Prevotella sp.]MCH4100587.1 hypothetical protein [Prevotella sp.]MCI1324516.1 hypothetical protein [Prevotella sp.]MCI1349211.1 hypothetical protein [Prevotella sp.]
MEESIVKDILRKSIRKRLIGHGQIDNILDNDSCITHWVTGIMALGYNKNDVEKVAWDLNSIQTKIFGRISFEDDRAYSKNLISFSVHRFSTPSFASFLLHFSHNSRIQK